MLRKNVLVQHILIKFKKAKQAGRRKMTQTLTSTTILSYVSCPHDSESSLILWGE